MSRRFSPQRTDSAVLRSPKSAPALVDWLALGVTLTLNSEMQNSTNSTSLLDISASSPVGSRAWYDSVPLSELRLRSSSTPAIAAAVTPLATGDGLRAEYFDNINFTNSRFTRTDATVNFNWGSGSPDSRIAADTFSVRWTGDVLAPTTGTYRFFTTSDDGVRLFVNDQLIVDNFRDQGATERSGTIDLVAGQRYAIRMEYYENGGLAVSQLAWEAPNIAKQIIPQSQLFSTSLNPPVTPTPGNGDGLKAEYFDNIDFTNLQVTRTDATVDFNWGNGSPDSRIAADTFSVRWTGDVLAPTTGTYRFFTTSDDGVRLFVNNQLVVDNYRDQGATEQSGTINLVAGQRYNLRMEYYENGGLAVSQLAWEGPNILKQIIPRSQLFSTSQNPPVTPTPGNGNGLRGEYFDNIDFTNLRVTRTDSTVDFNWGTGSPASQIGVDTFSVRWTGQIQPLYSERYTFFTTSDDGIRLFVNNQLVINNFRDQPPTEVSGSIDLVAGQRYDIRMEYYENGGGAVARLGWSSASQFRQIVPQSQLFSTPVVANPGTIVIGTNAVTVNESSGTATVRVDRINGSDGTATVRYTTADGSAIAGSDYTETVGQLVFAAGETSKTVTIPILNNNLPEGTEEFGFGLGETTGANLGTNRTALITILDDDAPASFALSSANYNVNEDAGTVTVTVQRSGNTAIAGSVNYATSNGTAIAGSDYTAATGTISFAANQTTQTFTVPITNDTTGERNETFSVTLSNPINGILGTQNTATVTIADNDPGNFARETVFTGLTRPTAFDWTSDGQYMFVAQQNGVVRVARNGVLQQTPAVDISSRVNGVRDRGLLGLAVHPDFSSTTNPTPYVYLLYTYDPPETAGRSGLAGQDGAGNRTARLGRFTATIAANGTVTIDPNSEVVILGRNSRWEFISRPDGNSTNDFNIPESGKNPDGTYVEDFLIIDSESHTVGTVLFGKDGYLYVSNGDGASYNAVDPRADRTLELDNLSGKILRIDPITGAAPSDNPFFDGNPNSNQSKVWQLGLRNPFRMTVNDDNGQLYIGDVGWTKWEEVNTGDGGENFGWVAYEGGNGTNFRTGGYSNLTSVQNFYAREQRGEVTVTAPVYAFEHFGSGGNAIVVGDFYTGTTFPSTWDRNLFITDVSKGTVDALSFGANGQVTGVRRFANNLFGLVQITMGSDGSLYYASIGSGEVGRWRPIA